MILFFVSSCKRSAPELKGIWNISSYTLNGSELSGSNLGNPRIEFNEEGGYMIAASGVSEKGTYTYKNKELTLHCTTQQKPDISYKVTTLDSTIMIYEAINDSNKLIVKLFKTSN